MFRNTIFVGGIHGVGKSTICKEISSQTGLKYLSASQVLKWGKVSESPNSKLVADVSHTQDLLLSGLKSLIVPEEIYLLEGHYCLLDSNASIARVPEETFAAINPVLFGLIVDDEHKIQERAKGRDGEAYTLALYVEMQAEEIRYANEIAGLINVPLKIFRPEEVYGFVNYIKQLNR